MVRQELHHGISTLFYRVSSKAAPTPATLPEKFDPRDYLKLACEAMKQVCMARMISFGQAGNASKLMASGRLK